MHIERAPVRADELAVTARLLLDLASAELDSVVFDASGSSVMPYDLDTLSSHLVDAYARFATETGLVESFPSTVKGVALSVPMSYAHLLGIYLFFTGEANRPETRKKALLAWAFPMLVCLIIDVLDLVLIDYFIKLFTK
jgi:hypothetical protein